MDKPLCSLIICTHNPDSDYFSRVLKSIREQSLSVSSYEFVIIDNKSDAGVLDAFDVSWHPHSRIIVEDELGLTAARLRGFRVTSADIIVFCDDDNVLASDYLEEAIRIANEYSFLGAWGGTCRGEFESTLPSWGDSGFLGSIGVREIQQISWSNQLNHCCPIGAGMVLRRCVAQAYVQKMQSSPVSRLLGRNGASLMSCEDIDLANTSIELGLGAGLFPELKLIHLIPLQRLTLAYYEKLAEGISTSSTLLRYMQGVSVGAEQPRKHSVREKLKAMYFRMKHSREEYVIRQARIRGAEEAMKIIRHLSSDAALDGGSPMA